MKTEYDYGYEYARWLIEQNQDGAGESVNVNDMLGSTSDIPEEDYAEMKRTGIENPNAREYWNGYNAACSSHDAARTMGSAKSARKAQTSRENGRLGGRPTIGAPWAVWCAADSYSPPLITRYYNSKKSAHRAQSQLSRNYSHVVVARKQINGEYAEQTD